MCYLQHATHLPPPQPTLLAKQQVLTKEAAQEAESSAARGWPVRLTTFDVAVTRSPEGAVDRFWLRGKEYGDLYALLRGLKVVDGARWELPPHRRLLAVAEPMQVYAPFSTSTSSSTSSSSCVLVHTRRSGGA